MAETSRIRIQNIYYMLAYAFQVLHEEGYKSVALEEFEHTLDLLSAILAKGIANQVKRGLGREYIPHTDALSSPRGKISISSSITEQSLFKKRLICEFDEFSENAYVNQILKTTALKLIHSEDVAKEQKKALKKVMLYFHNVDALNPLDIRWADIRYHSNNSTYKMLINICYLAMENLLLTEQTGRRKLSQFGDERMSSLFERFVREYYRKEHKDYDVSAPHIDWIVDDGITEALPNMKSDIVLEYNGNTLIIDTKYYSRTMQTNIRSDKKTIHSSNLYQIFTYVKNKDVERSGVVSGVLLYAKTDEDITPDNSYLMDGNRISVKTLDLDKEFADIKSQLDSVVTEWKAIKGDPL